VIDLAQRGETKSVKVCRIGGHSRCSQAGWEGCAEEEEKQHGLRVGSKKLHPPLVFFNPRLAEEKDKQGDEALADVSAAVFGQFEAIGRRTLFRAGGSIVSERAEKTDANCWRVRMCAG
jgi:hypothetical protein